MVVMAKRADKGMNTSTMEKKCSLIDLLKTKATLLVLIS